MVADRPRLCAADEVLPQNLAALMQSMARYKQQIHQAMRGNLEWTYDAILSHVVTSGPLRSSALADLVQTDPSTVSRQVAALVSDGLIERRADPDDGRATLLSVTRLGLRRHERHVAARNRHYRAMMSDWSAADRQRFAAYLERFTADFEAYKDTLLADLIRSVNSTRTAKEQA
jgi:DNA-binding MarR family transcriptional regulator